MTTINTGILEKKIKIYVTEFHEKKHKLKQNIYDEIQFLEGFIRETVSSLELVNKIKQSNTALKTIYNNDPVIKCLKKPLTEEHVLGSGEFGTVFKVDSKTAVKITDLKVYERFGLDVDNSIKHEAKICRLAGELGIGPKIDDIYYCCDVQGNCYSIMYMEMIHGKTLESWLDEAHSTREVQRVFYLLEKAIDTLHKNNIVHNDLHFENIFVKQQNKRVIGVYLIDFGLSSDVKTATKKLYARDKMAIEYLRSKVEPETDIYSYVVARLIDNKDVNIVK